MHHQLALDIASADCRGLHDSGRGGRLNQAGGGVSARTIPAGSPVGWVD